MVFVSETYHRDLNVKVICKYCQEDPPNLVENFSDGDLVCGTCGLVMPGGPIVDTRSEWRTFANDEGGDDPSRVGAASNDLLPGNQLDTIISSRDGSTGRARELARAQGKSTSARNERQLVEAHKIIQQFCDAINLPKQITDVVKHLYNRVQDAKTLKGKTQDSIIASCIVIATRQSDVPRTFKEICALTRVEKRDLGRVFKVVEKVLQEQAQAGETEAIANPHMDSSRTAYTATQATDAADLMSRFCSALDLPVYVQTAATELAKKDAAKTKLAGRAPTTIASAEIYFMSHLFGMGRSAADISKIAGVSDSTIRNAYKLLWAVKDQFMDERWIADKSTQPVSSLFGDISATDSSSNSADESTPYVPEEDDIFPAQQFFASAMKAGVLKNVDIESIYDILRQARAASLTAQPRLDMQRSAADPSTLSILGKILLRAKSAVDTPEAALERKKLGYFLLRSANTPEATIFISRSILRSPTATKEETEEAIATLSKLAQQNHPDAAVILGGVLQSHGDLTKASALYKIGAEAGNAEGYLGLGRIQRTNGNHHDALSSFKKAADMNHPYGHFMLAISDPDAPESMTHLEAAATKGIPEAAHNLGERHRLQGNKALAQEWYEVAARAGFQISMVNLAMMLKDNGEGKKASVWLEAAKRGGGQVAEDAQRYLEKWKTEVEEKKGMCVVM
ncbi:transcription initiation factor IIB [Saitoella coloradoensis]